MTQLNLLRVRCCFECLGWCLHGKGLMRAARVVELDPAGDGAGGVLNAHEAVAVNALLFQRPKRSTMPLSGMIRMMLLAPDHA
nr:hypothetical protein [Falsirhodobacter deserti]